MNVDDIDTYFPGAVVNLQRSDGSTVSAKTLGPLERGADYQSITNILGMVVTHDCAPVPGGSQACSQTCSWRAHS